MKVLLEVAQGSQQADNLSLFTWLKSKSSLLFILEDGKKMRTISTIQEPGKELQTATLVGTRVCSSLSCNEDGSLLALVVDRKQIYFWEVMTNSFVHFKPTTKMAYVSSGAGKKGGRPKDIDLIAWSKVSNKLVICFSTGQLLLCHCVSTIDEKFIDNSEGVLKQVQRITCSNSEDIFSVITVISEVLVMTYEGQALFYIQGEFNNLLESKLSRESQQLSAPRPQKHIWLAYQSKDNTVHFKRIVTKGFETETSSKADLSYRDPEYTCNLIDFYWTSPNELLLCYSNGRVLFMRIKDIHKGRSLIGQELSVEDVLQLPIDEDVFIQFSLVYDPSTCSHSLAAITNYKIFYYLKLERDHSFEKVDDLDLTNSLQKVHLNLTKVDWSNDGSMLAVQMSNGHILVYRTRLPDMKVSVHGARVAYCSGAGEVTILNFDPGANGVSNEDNESQLGEHGEKVTRGGGGDQVFATTTTTTIEDESNHPMAGNALVLRVGLKPAVLCVGPRHLALALNNRVQFYPLQQINRAEDKQQFAEEEYISVVTGLSLSSRFAAVQFNDARIKLQAIPQDISSPEPGAMNRLESDERFFPDPSKPEKISSFTLTEDTFIYSTHELQINVFSLNSWQLIQQTDYSSYLQIHLSRMYANSTGNKFICLIDDKEDGKNGRLLSGSAYLYDLYRGKFIKLLGGDSDEGNDTLPTRLFNSQLTTLLPNFDTLDMSGTPPDRRKPLKFDQIIDVVWDTNARTALLIERKWVHIITCFDHTLECLEGGSEDTVTVKYIDTVEKGTTYTTLYASHGIVSYQTRLGRVINTILVSHDDELKLNRLEASIRELKYEYSNVEDKSDNEAHKLNLEAEIMKLKLVYLRSILPLHSVARCKEICELLMSDKSFNIDDESKQISQIIWLQLAAWSLYLMNLEFALFLYRKFQLPVHARALSEIITNLNVTSSDSKESIYKKIMVLLGCDILD